MNLLRKIYSNPDFWPFIIVLFLGVLASRHLFTPGYFNMHDDLQMMRQLEMEKCFLDLQIPCRWVPDMGYGFGFPLFNFYPPLPYLVGEMFRVLGFSFVSVVKILFIIAFLASGLTMYFFTRNFLNRTGGVVAAAFYVWAPYHSVDVYVRGAMNEAWALIWFPLILLAGFKIITAKKEGLTRWIIILAFSYFGLFTSHNLMVLIFTPLFGVWGLLWLIREKAWSRLPHLAIAGVLAFGLAAFFTLPVLLESKVVQTSTLVQGYYEYSAHFVTLNQLLITRFWGFGPSVWMEADGMPFQIGHMHWILSIIVMGIAILRFVKTRKIDNIMLLCTVFFIFGWATAFLTHTRSIAVWLALTPLHFVQFPWRFLTIVILSFSFLVGILITWLPKKHSKLISLALIVGLLMFNWEYFKPQNGALGPLTDEQKFAGAAWELQQTAGIYDYLPIQAKKAPQAPRRTVADFVEGEGEISEKQYRTNMVEFTVNSTSESVIRLSLLIFPGWKVYVDGQETQTFIPETEEWGRIHTRVPAGMHTVSAKLTNTWPRTVGNSISLISWIGLVTFPLWKRKFSS